MDENKIETTNEELNQSVNEASEPTEQERCELISSGEVESDIAESETVPEQPPKKARGRKGLMIGGAIASIVVSTVLLVCVAVGMFSIKNPIDRTMDAVFPEVALLDEIAVKGGSVSFDASIGPDLSDQVKGDPVKLQADFVLGSNGVLLGGALGGGQEELDVGLLIDGEGAQIYSKRLVGGGYSIPFEGLMEAIDQSIFAPDSGTDYALPQELYDMLDEYIDSLDDPEDSVEYEAIEGVLLSMLDAARQEATFVEEEKRIALLDGTTKATLYAVSLDVRAFNAAFDVLLDEWKHNEAFYDELSSLLELYMLEETTDAPMDVDDAMDALYDELKTALDEASKYLDDSDINVCVAYAVHSGYLVYMCADVDMSIEVDTSKARADFSMHMGWTFTSNPSKDPSYDIVATARLDDEIRDIFRISHRMEGDRFTLTAQLGEALTETDNAVLTLQGRRSAKSNAIELTLDTIVVTNGDETQFEMKESSFTLSLESGKQKVHRAQPDTNLLTMTVEEMDDLGETLETELERFQRDINRELGFDFFRDTLMQDVQGSLMLEEGAYDYAYDRESGHLFLATERNNKHYIVMYDIETMQPISEVRISREICAMDADGGYLATTDQVMPDDDAKSTLEVQIFDAATLEHIKTLDMNAYGYLSYEYSGDLIVDETRLIYATGNQHCEILFVDIETEELIAKADRTVYHCSLAIDRENHVVAANERGLSTCEFYMFDSTTGALIRKGNKKDSYNSDPVYFDGISFFSYGYHFMSDGTEIATTKLITDRKLEDREDKFLAMVYKDSDILVTLEQDKNGVTYTMFYELNGQNQGAPLFEKLSNVVYTEIIKLGDGTYIALSYLMGIYPQIEYFTIEETVDIGF